MDNIKKSNIIDFVRGICIFLMFYGHCIQYASLGYISYFDNRLFRFIYSFHMPLFMIISGWCFYYSFCKRNLINLLAHRIYTLVIPIISCGILGLFFIKVLPSLLTQNSLDISFLDIKDCFNLFWFLWSIIACSIPVAIAYKATNNRLIRIVILCLGLVVTYLLPNKIENIYMYPYFIFGFVLSRNYKDKLLNKYKTMISLISGVVFIIMLLFFKNDYYIYTTGIFGINIRQFGINIFRYIIGFAGSIAVCYVLEIVYIFFINRNHFAGFINKICYLGSNSVKFYTLSVIFLSYYLSTISHFVSGYIDYSILTSNIFIYDIIMFFVAIIYCIIIKLFIRMLDLIGISKILYYK